MIKTILVENKKHCNNRLATLIDHLKEDLLIIARCTSIGEAVTVVKVCKPHLFFLDVLLSDGNGAELPEQTYGLDYKVIFVTIKSREVLKSLNTTKTNYISKPIDTHELTGAIAKAFQIGIAPLNKGMAEEKVTNTAIVEKGSLVLSLYEGYQVIYFEELKFCSSEKGWGILPCSDLAPLLSTTIKRANIVLTLANVRSLFFWIARLT